MKSQKQKESGLSTVIGDMMMMKKTRPEQKKTIAIFYPSLSWFDYG